VFQFPASLAVVLDLRTVSDRLEIDDLLTAYTFAIDAGDFDRLDQVFTPDAWIDYTATGGVAGPFPEVRAWLAETLPSVFTSMQHVLAQREVRVEGDRASVRAYMLNPLVIDRPDGSRWQRLIGGVYVHDLVRTPDGWRSRRLVEELLCELVVH
jgi:ketosteroid isomerase-like protein